MKSADDVLPILKELPHSELHKVNAYIQGLITPPKLRKDVDRAQMRPEHRSPQAAISHIIQTKGITIISQSEVLQNRVRKCVPQSPGSY